MMVQHASSRSMRFLVRIMEWRYKKTKRTILASRHGKSKQIVPKKPFIHNVIEDVSVYSLLRSNTDVHIIYLHGGAYVHYGDTLHFGFLNRLAKQAHASVHYIDYPLAPTSTVTQTTQKTIQIVQTLQNQHIGRFFVLGDSSGGGLAMAISNQLNNIHGYILMSPWMDVSLSNPDLRQEQYQDGFYTIEELRECGSMYAPNMETSPLASPLYLEQLPEVPFVLYTGTADVLSPDIERMEQLHPSITLHRYEGAPHVFPLFPFMKEQKDFIETVIAQTKSR